MRMGLCMHRAVGRDVGAKGSSQLASSALAELRQGWKKAHPPPPPPSPGLTSPCQLCFLQLHFCIQCLPSLMEAATGSQLCSGRDGEGRGALITLALQEGRAEGWHGLLVG